MTKETKGLIFLVGLGGLAYYLFGPKKPGANKSFESNVGNHPFVAAPGAVNAPLSETHPLVPAPRIDESDDRGQVPTPVSGGETYDQEKYLFTPDAGYEGPSMDPNDIRFN